MSNGSTTPERDDLQCQRPAVADETSSASPRAAVSPIIWDMLDYSCALFAPHGEMLAQAETIPAQLGVMSYALAGITAEIPLIQWREGDVLVCNSAYLVCVITRDVAL